MTNAHGELEAHGGCGEKFGIWKPLDVAGTSSAKFKFKFKFKFKKPVRVDWCAFSMVRVRERRRLHVFNNSYRYLI